MVVSIDEETVGYTLAEFVKATRPDGKGYIYLDGAKIAEFEEVVCDSCNADIVQPEDQPDKQVVFVYADRAWCEECFEQWVKPEAEQ